ncbi:uncharacterized protein LOC100179468 isoform X3 [Ciona intestinalis]
MEKYDNLGMVGEGSYGMVMKCKHKESGQIVAIKKFLESEDDKMVKKIAMREVRMLRKLHHENLVNLIEVFRRRKRLYLVFEFVDHTVLDDLEKYPNGLNEMTVRKILWQVLRGVEFCHSHNIIHRDIKPENILNSRSGVIKLCDFGFARTLAAPGEVYTDYVATRWYRAPELLVGDTKYGRAVDIWAVGCLVGEMLQGDPIFPGKSDIDQLNRILKCVGNLCPRHREIFQRNPLFAGMRLPDVRDIEPLERRFPKFSSEVLDLMKQCLRLDPNDRPSSSLLLRHEFFKKEGFEEKVIPELRARIMKDNAHNALSRKEALEKREQERRKKKSKEMAAENVDSNLPAAKKHDKNVNSPSKQEISSVKKTSNKPPATTPPVENKKQRKDTEKEKKPLSQTKTDSSKKSTQEEVSSNFQQKTKNSSNSHEKKSSSTKQDLTEAQPVKTAPNGILKTPPSKRTSNKSEADESQSKKKSEKASGGKIKNSNPEKTAEITSERKQPTVTSETKHNSPKKSVHIADTPTKSTIPPIHTTSKNSTPDSMLLLSSNTTPHIHQMKQTNASSGPPAFKGSDRIKKTSTLTTIKKNENSTSQGSFDRNMYPDKTSHFEKMMMSMSGTTSITHPAIKKSNIATSGPNLPFSLTSPGASGLHSNFKKEEKSFLSNSDQYSNDSYKSDMKQSTNFEELLNREKSPKHKREPKTFHLISEGKTTRELKSDSQHTRLPDLNQKPTMSQEFLPDLKKSGADGVVKVKKTKHKLVSIPTLDHPSRQHRSRSPSPNPPHLTDSNFPRVNY